MGNLEKFWDNQNQKEQTHAQINLPEEKKAPITQATETKIAKLKSEPPMNGLEIKASSPWRFESIKESFEEKESLSKLFKTFEGYIEQKITATWDTFSLSEQDTIKVVMWDEIQNLFSTKWSLWVFINMASEWITSSLEPLRKISAWEDTNQTETLSSLMKAWKQIIDWLWKDTDTHSGVMQYLDGKTGRTIDSLVNIKNTSPHIDMSQISIVQQILKGSTNIDSLVPVHNNDFLLNEIKQRSEKLGVFLEEKSEVWEQFINAVDSLPEMFWDNIKTSIKFLLEKMPFLKFLTSLFIDIWYLEDFLSWKNKERKESFKDLIILSWENNSLVSWIFPEGFWEEFDIKNIENFYEFLETKEINYKKWSFWPEVLSGKTTDPKILEISTVLKGKYGEELFTPKDSENGWELLSKKLNSLPKLISEKEGEARKQQLNKTIAELPDIPRLQEQEESTQEVIYTPIDSSLAGISQENPFTETERRFMTPVRSSTPPEKQASISPEIISQYTKARNDIISDAIASANSFPINVDYWDKDFEATGIELIHTIDFKNGELLIGNETYQIHFAPFTKDIKVLGRTVKQITVSDLSIIWDPHITNTDFMLMCRTEEYNTQVEKPLSKEEASILILWLLDKWGFSWEIPGDSDTSKIPYTVTKVSSNQNIS